MLFFGWYKIVIRRYLRAICMSPQFVGGEQRTFMADNAKYMATHGIRTFADLSPASDPEKHSVMLSKFQGIICKTFHPSFASRYPEYHYPDAFSKSSGDPPKKVELQQGERGNRYALIDKRGIPTCTMMLQDYTDEKLVARIPPYHTQVTVTDPTSKYFYDPRDEQIVFKATCWQKQSNASKFAPSPEEKKWETDFINAVERAHQNKTEPPECSQDIMKAIAAGYVAREVPTWVIGGKRVPINSLGDVKSGDLGALVAKIVVFREGSTLGLGPYVSQCLLEKFPATRRPGDSEGLGLLRSGLIDSTQTYHESEIPKAPLAITFEDNSSKNGLYGSDGFPASSLESSGSTGSTGTSGSSSSSSSSTGNLRVEKGESIDTEGDAQEEFFF
jgi:hypothetical protein